MSQNKNYRLKPLSMYPLTVKEAMSAFMAVNPEKVEKRLEREKISCSEKK